MPALINLSYLVAAILFILGLKGLTHPRTAVRGNLLGACGMLLAVAATLCDRQILDFTYIIAGVITGSAIGVVLSQVIKIKAMPQLVALFNGFGGLASVLVAGAELMRSGADTAAGSNELQFTLSVFVSGLIGTVTFWGSLVAFAKFQEWKWIGDVRLPGRQLINAGLFAAALGLIAWGQADPPGNAAYWLLVLSASVLGVLLVIPIGGADMPVVVALLNSYSGLAAAATGFVLQNNVLIIAGSLVGASGLILTQIMCKAMNRSLAHVLFGTLEPATDWAGTDDEIYANVKSASADEVAMLLETAQRVVIVPGYGMAVAQAQHAVHDLAKALEKRGITVEFGIHPVAGRMPGHMNVLLAEANVAYEQLKEMDEVNPEMEQVDVALVIGANDVVNPLARTDPDCPIAGMPIIDVDRARTAVVIKRSLSPGFAGIANPLFAAENNLMLFGDGRQAVVDVIAALDEG